jgi:hypothetical protein
MILEYLKNLSTTQIIFLTLGLVLVVASSKDVVINFIKNLYKTPSTPNNTIPSKKIDLTTIVAQWETLANSCKESNLTSAYEKLQEVFPMLISVYNTKHTKNYNEK